MSTEQKCKTFLIYIFFPRQPFICIKNIEEVQINPTIHSKEECLNSNT